ncbi:hypothetical protein ACJ73_06540 [Blastomyces percursus]|uniref:Uncharacterized protein n=1 Tax=Blastomyces percursus TaxID=1658174 RepID=A0A1J9QPK1_9EURO|nr:hypothetical protein ACJ73_06540 [Blastomyces percursus]
METRTLSEILQKLSPSTVLDSEALLRAFHEFFLRGTPEQFTAYSVSIAGSAHPTITFNSAGSSVIHPLLFDLFQSPSPVAASGNRESTVSDNVPYEFFTSQQFLHLFQSLSSDIRSMAIAMPYQFFLPFRSKSWGEPDSPPFKKRRRNVGVDKQDKSRVTGEWLKLKAAFKDKLLPTSFEAILTHEGLIDSNLQKGRRLYKSITTAASNIANQIIAYRLSLIYSVHEIDSHSKYVCGKKLKTAAYEQVSKEWDCSLACVKRCERWGKSYTRLIQEAGPAIIFELDNDVSSLCENGRLTDDQRKLFTQWLLTQSKQNRFAKCISAANIILEGLIAYGYTYPELRTTQSRLLNVLRVHLSWEDGGTIYPNKGLTSMVSTDTNMFRFRSQRPCASNVRPGNLEPNRKQTQHIQSTDNSPYYSGLGGSRAVECHNDSFSKQPVYQNSPIGEAG